MLDTMGRYMQRTLNIPYYRQPSDYTCAPTALKMLLAFYGDVQTIEFLESACKTTSDEGTATDDLENAARKQGFTVRASVGNTIVDLKSSIDAGIPSLINFIDQKSGEGHFAVCVGYSETHIILHDPENGPHFEITFTDLENNWRSGFENKQRYMMSIRPEASPL